MCSSDLLFKTMGEGSENDFIKNNLAGFDNYGVMFKTTAANVED